MRVLEFLHNATSDFTKYIVDILSVLHNFIHSCLSTSLSYLAHLMEISQGIVKSNEEHQLSINSQTRMCCTVSLGSPSQFSGSLE